MVMPAGALTLKGGVKYTVESAREEAFRNIEYQIPMEPHKKYLKDPGYTPGEGGKKPKISKKGRYVNHFTNGSYCVSYYTKWKYVYVYNSKGLLKGIDIQLNYNSFPQYSWGYDLKGKLTDVTFWVSKNESYIYDLNGKLIAHWVGDTAYDENGQIMMLRLNK